MTEHRHLKRRHLLYYLRVTDRHCGAPLGNLVDITREGLMLVTRRPVEARKVHRLRLHLPREVLPENYVDLDAESVWTRPDANPDLHVTGFRILDLTTVARQAIDQLVDDFGFSD